MSVRNLDASADWSVVTRSFKTSSSLDRASVMMAPESTRPSVDFEALRQPFCEVTLKDTTLKKLKTKKNYLSLKVVFKSETENRTKFWHLQDKSPELCGQDS